MSKAESKIKCLAKCRKEKKKPKNKAIFMFSSVKKVKNK